MRTTTGRSRAAQPTNPFCRCTWTVKPRATPVAGRVGQGEEIVPCRVRAVVKTTKCANVFGVIRYWWCGEVSAESQICAHLAHMRCAKSAHTALNATDESQVSSEHEICRVNRVPYRTAYTVLYRRYTLYTSRVHTSRSTHVGPCSVTAVIVSVTVRVDPPPVPAVWLIRT